ncbi:hypothetical protein RM423_13200 [Jatrophihabitans sp. DSM 44399]|uniref:Uncharacterized protein n=1 Tax=Jatrophihabitans lederbergiae TaxID=3075547 RepID=A0ABU2JBI2_9ACTN|nr:hypothetical protein [Jatrophihabitans sp. DSM 44399]MDT0262347.1 hypothetical protein [Jatrophihabitans sp. DSM 44399]
MLTQPSVDTSTNVGTKVTAAGTISVNRIARNTPFACRYGIRASP